MYSHTMDAFQHAISALDRQRKREVSRMKGGGSRPARNLVGEDPLYERD